MARLLTPELEAAIDTALPPPEDNRRPPLDQLAGEIAALEAWAVEAQASCRRICPRSKPPIDALPKRRAWPAPSSASATC